MGLIEEALARQNARPRARMIDYARMSAVRPGQKAALTWAVKSRDPETVARVVKAAIEEWNAIGAWPDDWSRWQNALDDVLPWNQRVDIADL